MPVQSLIQTKRIYEEPLDTDGTRVLIDRFWPRGVKKEAAKLDAWCKDTGPSHELRKRFHAAHADAPRDEEDAEAHWNEFRALYLAELDANPEAAAEPLAFAAEGPLTLRYAARDETRNHAIVLQEWLEAHRR